MSGVAVQTVAIPAGESRRVRCWSPAAGLAYIELRAHERGTTELTPFSITIGPP